MAVRSEMKEFALKENYEEDYSELMRRSLDFRAKDRVVVDFRRFVDLFILYVLEGSGEGGITGFCSSIVSTVLHHIEGSNIPELGNWTWRLKHLKTYLMAVDIPPLRLLDEVSNCLMALSHDFCSQPPEWKNRSVNKLLALRKRWLRAEKETSELITETLREQDRILVVGHSKVIENALRHAKAAGLKLAVSYFAPTPSFPDGQNQSHLNFSCSMKHMSTCITRQEALAAIRSGEIDQVLIAACAYTRDRRKVWVTAKGRQIVKEANVVGIPCRPVAAASQRIHDTVAPDQPLPESSVADVLDITEDTIDTSFLD